MIQQFNSLQASSGLILGQEISVKEILRTYCLASNAISIIPTDIKNSVKDRLGLESFERSGTFKIKCVPDGLTKFQKTLLKRLGPLATRFSILCSLSISDPLDSFEQLDKKLDEAFSERVERSSMYCIEPNRINFDDPVVVDGYKTEFKQFLIGVFFPQMLINEVPVADEIIREFVNDAKIKTKNFGDLGFWSEYSSVHELCKICSIPAYIKERNKQIVHAGVLEKDLIVSKETVLKMQMQIDLQCQISGCRKCDELLRNFSDGERPENTETQIILKNEIKLKLR